MSRSYRLAGIALLCLATIALCVAYAGADLWDRPTAADVAAEPDDYDGERALLFGVVQSADPGAGSLVIDAAGRELEVRSVDSAVFESVEPGGEIQVYGLLTRGSTVVVADEVVVDYGTAGDWQYVIATSLLGAALAAGYFLGHWRIDWRGFRFEPRGDRDG